MARTIAGGLGQQAVILNRGVSGEMAEGTAERIRSEVDDTVRSTIRWLKENRIDVVLVGVQYTVCLARDANYVA
jgi:acyl-CoA thioesterase-1